MNWVPIALKRIMPIQSMYHMWGQIIRVPTYAKFIGNK